MTPHMKIIEKTAAVMVIGAAWIIKFFYSFVIKACTTKIKNDVILN